MKVEKNPLQQKNVDPRDVLKEFTCNFLHLSAPFCTFCISFEFSHLAYVEVLLHFLSLQQGINRPAHLCPCGGWVYILHSCTRMRAVHSKLRALVHLLTADVGEARQAAHLGADGGRDVAERPLAADGQPAAEACGGDPEGAGGRGPPPPTAAAPPRQLDHQPSLRW